MVNIKRCAMILHAIRCLLKATLIQKAVRGWIVRRQYKKDIKGNKQMLKSFRCLDGHSNLCFVFSFRHTCLSVCYFEVSGNEEAH